MGRFYKTAKPIFVDDIIYQAPHELMQQALQNKDVAFEAEQQKVDAMSVLGDNLEFTDQDKDQRNNILNQQRQVAEDLAAKMAANPATYQAHSLELNQARKNLEQSVTSGSLFEMDRTAKRRKVARDEQKTLFEKGTITADQYHAAVDNMDKNYQGYGQGEDYMESIHTYKHIDEGQFAKNLKDTINVDSKAWSTSKPDGEGYMTNKAGVKTYLTKERLDSIIENDPETRAWERENLQTFTRQLENGTLMDDQGQPITDKEDMQALYRDRKEQFKNSVIEKLNYEKTSSTSTVSSDSTALSRISDEREDDILGSGFTANETGQFNKIPDSDIAGIYGELPATQSFRGTDIPAPTPAQMRVRLETEKNVLVGKMTENGVQMPDLMERASTVEGMILLAQELGVDQQVIARQANYNKNLGYNFTDVRSPFGDGTNVRENIGYLQKTNQVINNMGSEQEFDEVKIILPDGSVESTSTGMTVGEVDAAGYTQPPTIATTTKELIWDETEKGYVDTSGDGVVKMPDEDAEDGERNATKEEALASGKAKSKFVKVQKVDPNKPLVNITAEQLRQTKSTDYKDGYMVPTSKDLIVVRTSFIDKDGVRKEAIMTLDKNKLGIKPTKKQ